MTVKSSVEKLRDQIAVLEYRAGDVDALAGLISRWQARIYSYISAMLRDRNAAWDVSQEVWMAVIRALSGRAEIEDFGAWLYGTARNQCFRHLKRERRLEDSHGEAADAAEVERDDAGTTVFAWEDAAAVRECLLDLSLPLREAMFLFYMDGLTIEDVAGVLGIPRGTVQSRLHYGRRKLREMLERKGYGNDRG